ncbi:glycosyltransferase [Empedobacter falsenii]
MKNKINIWGSLPEPYGGVSVHVQRLIQALEDFDNVELLNFSKGNQVITQKNIRKSNNFFIEFIKVLFKKNIIVHLHTNRLIVLLLFSFLKRKKYIITLHNKRFLDLEDKKKNLFILSLKNARLVFSNDYAVQDLLINKNVNIVKVPAFLPPQKQLTSIKLPEEFTLFRCKYKYVFSMSVFGFNYLDKDDYGLKKIVELLKKIEAPELGICLCISQPNPFDLECFINDIRVAGLENRVLFLINKISNGSDIWENSDAFLRLNNTDIEGLSIKEALLLNVPVIASDVCSRPNDAIVYKSEDFDDLINKFTDLLKHNEKYKEELKKSTKSDIINALDIIKPIYKEILK